MSDFIPILSLIYFILAGFIVLVNFKEKKIIEILNPVIFYSILWSIPFAVIPILIYFNLVDSSEILTYSKSNMYNLIFLSQIMAIISLLFLFIGFRLGKKINLFKLKNFCNRNKHTRNKHTWNIPKVLFAWVFYFILILLFIKKGIETGNIFRGVNALKQQEIGMLGYLTSLFGINAGNLFYMGFLTLLSIIAYNYTKNKLFLFLTIFSFIFNTAVGIYASQKEMVATQLLIVFYYLYYFKRNISIKKEMLIFLLVVFFLFSFPLFNLYRGYLNIQKETPDITGWLNFIVNNLDFNTIISNLNYLLFRFDHLNTNLYILDSDKYKFGVTYLLGITSFIAGLPKMPKEEFLGVGFNNSFAREYGIISQFDYNTHVTLPQFTEAYMNFGIISIPVIMFVWGIFYRKIYNLIRADEPNKNLFGFFLWYIFVFQGSAVAFSSMMFSLGRVLIGIIFVFFILNFKLKYLKINNKSFIITVLMILIFSLEQSLKAQLQEPFIMTTGIARDNISFLLVNPQTPDEKLEEFAKKLKDAGITAFQFYDIMPSYGFICPDKDQWIHPRNEQLKKSIAC